MHYIENSRNAKTSFRIFFCQVVTLRNWFFVKKTGHQLGLHNRLLAGMRYQCYLEKVKIKMKIGKFLFGGPIEREVPSKQKEQENYLVVKSLSDLQTI